MWQARQMASIQALSDSDRRTVARWALACAERVVPLFEADLLAQNDIQDAIARTRAYSEGRGSTAEEIGKRMIAVKAAKPLPPRRCRGGEGVAQASAVAHMGAHALGAAAYAVKAVVGEQGSAGRVDDGSLWQIADLRPNERAALRLLPPLGQDRSVHWVPGFCRKGILGSTIRGSRR